MCELRRRFCHQKLCRVLAIHLIELVSHRSYEGMRTRRVIWPLLSQ